MEMAIENHFAIFAKKTWQFLDNKEMASAESHDCLKRHHILRKKETHDKKQSSELSKYYLLMCQYVTQDASNCLHL